MKSEQKYVIEVTLKTNDGNPKTGYASCKWLIGSIIKAIKFDNPEEARVWAATKLKLSWDRMEIRSVRYYTMPRMTMAEL